MPDDRSFHVLDGVAARLDVSPAHPRRRWSAQAKAHLVEETLKPGANVSAIARAAGIAPAQLFGWRRQAVKDGIVQREPRGAVLGFVDVTPEYSGGIEIVVADVVIRAGANVSLETLTRAVRAVRSA